jgi:S1-C subfamily serine protease
MWKASLLIAVAAGLSAGAWWLGRAEREALEQRLVALEVLDVSDAQLSRGHIGQVRQLEERLGELVEVGDLVERDRDEVFGRIGITEANLAELAAELDLRERRIEELEQAQRTILEDLLEEQLGAAERERAELTVELAETRAQLEAAIERERDQFVALEQRLADSQAAREEQDPEILWRRFMGPVVQLAGDISVGSGTLLRSQPIPGREHAWRTHVLTAWHVVRDMQDDPRQPVTPIPVRIYLEDGRHRDEIAHVIVRQEAMDVALLELDTTVPVTEGALLPQPQTMAAARTFHSIVAVGCPLGTDPIPTRGQVASTSHTVDGQRYWMINAPTYIGNSGGAVFDESTGELMGVFSKIYNHGTLRPTIVPHMGLVTPMDDIYGWLETCGWGVDGEGLLMALGNDSAPKSGHTAVAAPRE